MNTPDSGNPPRLVVNRWITPDGTILHSKYRHDFISYYDTEDKYYMLDGGIEGYVRTSGDLTSLCLYEDDEHSEIRKYFSWRTYGKEGNEPGRWVTLDQMSNLHIDSILRTQSHIRDTVVQKVFVAEIAYRLDHGIIIEG